VSSEEIADIMSNSIAGLASIRPGKGYDFAFTTKAFAMNATGLPVIYSGVGPVKKIIAENNLGVVCDWDIEEVAEAMRRILKNEYSIEERKRIAEWANANFSLDAVAKKV